MKFGPLEPADNIDLLLERLHQSATDGDGDAQDAIDAIRFLRKEHDIMLLNLNQTQQRCTELLEEVRELRWMREGLEK